MNETPAPQHLRDYVEEMVEIGVQLATMLDHMYLFQLQNPRASGEPPPEVLSELVAKTLQRRFRTSKKEILRATNILRLSSRTIADELILVEPGALDDLDDLDDDLDDDFEGELDLTLELPDLYGIDGDASNGNHLH